jgi:hypothetical protein
MLLIALTIGLATAINIIVLITKLKSGNWEHFLLEVGALVILSLLFGQTVLGMLVAMVSSLSLSVWLAFGGGRTIY